jgi:hypothetical protein
MGGGRIHGREAFKAFRQGSQQAGIDVDAFIPQS